MSKELLFNSYNTSMIVNGFASYFETKLTDERSNLSLTIPQQFGEGSISAVDFHDGIRMMIFNCTLKKDLLIRYKCDDTHPLRLLFCVENDLKHVIKGDRLQYQLTYLLGSMVSGSRNQEEVFLIPAEKPVCYYSIEIDRQKYHTKIQDVLSTLPVELREVFLDVEATKSFLYQGHYSLTIAQCIQNIHKNEYKGLVRRIYLESQTLEILSMQIKQFIDDLEPSQRQSVLRKRDMELIIEARNRLVSDLIKPPTIRELARMTGTNPNKLKKGFRLLYNTSINKLLQNERLSKAKLLIAEEAYPISEIARMVGYRHTGHFSAKFKKKFGMLPKEYVKTMLHP